MQYQVGDRVLCQRVVQSGQPLQWLPGTVIALSQKSRDTYQVELDGATPGWFYHTEMKSES